MLFFVFTTQNRVCGVTSHNTFIICIVLKAVFIIMKMFLSKKFRKFLW